MRGGQQRGIQVILTGGGVRARKRGGEVKLGSSTGARPQLPVQAVPLLVTGAMACFCAGGSPHDLRCRQLVPPSVIARPLISDSLRAIAHCHAVWSHVAISLEAHNRCVIEDPAGWRRPASSYAMRAENSIRAAATAARVAGDTVATNSPRFGCFVPWRVGPPVGRCWWGCAVGGALPSPKLTAAFQPAFLPASWEVGRRVVALRNWPRPTLETPEAGVKGTSHKGKTTGQLTDLVEYLIGRLRERHRPEEDIPDLVQALALGPVVEGARHIDFFGLVRPVAFMQQQLLAARPWSRGGCDSWFDARVGARTHAAGQVLSPGMWE